MAGGSCRSGAMSAGFSAFAGHVPGVNQLGLVARVAVGAVASRLGGGKAENGALSAAFQYLFNDVLLETTKQLGGLHQRIAVRGKDSTLYEGVSFGIIGGKPQDGLIESYENKPSPRGQGSGGVYRDFDDKLGTLRSFATTPREDNLIIQYLSGRLGETGRYNALSNSCRDFSQFEFDKITSEVTRARMERRDPVFGR